MTDTVGKIQNVSGDDRLVPLLGGRLVLAGQAVDVPVEHVTSFTQQTAIWSPYDDVAKRLHNEMLDGLAELLADGLVNEAAAAGLDVEQPAKALVAAIGETDDVDGLQALRAATEAAAKPRPSVLKAIDARLAELTSANDDPAGEPGNTPNNDGSEG